MITAGRTAFVTGGASGIGRALCGALAAEGMNVVVADADRAKSQKVAQEIVAAGGHACAIGCDVAIRSEVEAAAEHTIATFGAVHLLCNNAGVAVSGEIGTMRPQDWDWVLDVNLKGVIHGVEAFLPHLRAHGEGGHILNTASVGGFLSSPFAEAYSATKHAVVAMSEGWAAQLAKERIGVSLLCPHFVRTNIVKSEAVKPVRYQTNGIRPSNERSLRAKIGVEQGLDPAIVAARALEGIRAGELYIFTHPNARPHLKAYFANILRALDAAEASEALAAVESWASFVPATD